MKQKYKSTWSQLLVGMACLLAFNDASAIPAGNYDGLVEFQPGVAEFGGTITLTVSSRGVLSGSFIKPPTRPWRPPRVFIASLQGTSFSVVSPAEGITVLANYHEAPLARFTGEVLETSSGRSVAAFIAYPCHPNPAALAGHYTFAMKIPAGDPTWDNNENAPQGYSYGAFKVSPTGIATGIIKLADESPVQTFSGCVSSELTVPINKVLYGGQGSFWGCIGGVGVGLDASEFYWKKNPVGTGRYFKNGFGTLNLETFGRRLPTPAPAVAMNIVSPGAQISFSRGLVPSPTTRMDVNAANGGAVALSNTTAAFTVPMIWPAYTVGAPVTAGHAKFGGNVFKARYLSSATFTPGTHELITSKVSLKDTNTINNSALIRTNTMSAMVVEQPAGTFKAYGYMLLQEMPSLLYPSATTTPYHSARVLVGQ